MRYVCSDGGRWASGFKGLPSGDCVCRAVSIASGRPYREVYAMLRVRRAGRGFPEWGICTKCSSFRRLMRRLGFRLVKTRFDRRVIRLRHGDLPRGRLVVTMRQHCAAVIDGVLFDHSDTSNQGRAIVHRYYIYEGSPVSVTAPAQRPSHVGIKAMFAELISDLVYEFVNYEYTYAYSEECKARALKHVAAYARWRDIDQRRWWLAVARALDVVHANA